MSARPVSSLSEAECALRTSRLALDLVRPDDADAYHPLMADGELTRFLAWAPHADVAQTRDVLCSLAAARDADRGLHWAVRTANGTLAGLVSLIDLRYRHLTWRLDRAELAYWIRPDEQGQGYATEASRAVLDFAFSQVGLHKVLVAHATTNSASAAVARRLGFSAVGTHRQAFEKDGTWHDLLYYERIASEHP